jgi:hypothetical protein
MSTEAGKRLLDDIAPLGLDGEVSIDRQAYERVIAAIEAEARADALTEAAERVWSIVIGDGWEGDAAGKSHDHIDGYCGFRAAVLAILEESK